MKPRCVILGAGGHASVLIDCLRLADSAELAGLLDPNRELWGKNLHGVPVLGDDQEVATLDKRGITHFVIGLGGTGNNRPREQLFEMAVSHGLTPLTVIHPTAICSESAEISPGAQLLPGSIVNAGAHIGPNVIVNSGAIVEHDDRIEAHVHIATGAKLASTVHVGRGAHIGAGATVIQCVNIGEYAIVGAGSVVIRDIQAEITVVGVPAHPIDKTNRMSH